MMVPRSLQAHHCFTPEKISHFLKELPLDLYLSPVIEEHQATSRAIAFNPPPLNLIRQS